MKQGGINMKILKKLTTLGLRTFVFLLNCIQTSSKDFEAQQVKEYEASWTYLPYESWQKGIKIDDTE
jgi:hypothetical protein